jgi:hypothetical protein
MPDNIQLTPEEMVTDADPDEAEYVSYLAAILESDQRLAQSRGITVTELRAQLRQQQQAMRDMIYAPGTISTHDDGSVNIRLALPSRRRPVVRRGEKGSEK